MAQILDGHLGEAVVVDHRHTNSSHESLISLVLKPLPQPTGTASQAVAKEGLSPDVMPSEEAACDIELSPSPSDAPMWQRPDSSNFGAISIISGWQPLPGQFLHSIYERFPTYYVNTGRVRDSAAKAAWLDNPVSIPSEARVRVQYGLNSWFGKLLFRGYGVYSDRYRVKRDGGDDDWVECWRCTVDSS